MAGSRLSIFAFADDLNVRYWREADDQTSVACFARRLSIRD